ncbi:glycogen debranching protein GlgX [Cereibacter azotoformans]|uniref:Glycogen debranching enzyme GlgX n=1 Tax=Cereibacter sphaeroides (strain ATCC 17025 / ATH 2.4.3) TaxID=349102 RepID=A4WUU3_CERS5|nr:glycogen debranching protein GlgX [Cereibacter azotoformans]ULB10369.1 glycogen debranching protein GlgX [Cereibacter azotoformans]
MKRPVRPAPPLKFDISSGHPNRLGADFDGEGTNFALFSENATRVELCLFDETGRNQTHCMDLPAYEGGIWYGYLPGIREGQAYGYRVHGPHAPEEGHRFNPNKLLIDPYARELRGDLVWDDALFGYPVGGDDLELDPRDSAPFMPKAVVVDPAFDWEADKALRHRWEETVIYEAHVKGLTMRHPGVPDEDRGTFRGLASPAVIDHLKAIGVTAIELLPVHGFLNDRHLIEKDLSNYWGYNTLSFFAPYRPYTRSGSMREVKQAIKRFHDAGIEVILDVVYNHTCEGNEKGPTLSFRGIDNASYYLLSPEAKRHSFDTTGTGNTLNVAHPMVLRMVMDSLRYWVEVMHVDGFRFDLASTLGREPQGFERGGSFFASIRQDPVLSMVKLIAEPWDIGEGGYQVGGFPWPFREWNDKARDDLRAFWRRDPGLTGDVSQRLLGSPVQFSHSHRPATSSINFIAAHDGFTAWDLVSYDEKHNEANGEDNRDGHSHNLSHNLGVEGPTDDPGILEARLRRVKAMLATLFVSQGVPMILAGDEFGQSQQGNNNAYCQDNEIAWLDWPNARADLIRAVSDLAAFRRSEGGLARARFAAGPDAVQHDTPVASWLHPAGRDMEEGDWNDGDLRLFGLRLDLPKGRDLLILLNAGDDGEFALPEGAWRLQIDTARETIACDEPAEGTLAVGWQSVMVLAAPD